MTTNIKVQSHNYPARVEIIDHCGDSDDVVETRILFPEDGEVLFYCTTSREIHVTDLEYDHPAVLARKSKE